MAPKKKQKKNNNAVQNESLNDIVSILSHDSINEYDVKEYASDKVELCKSRCVYITLWILSMYDAGLFNQPVDHITLGLDDYLEVISEPMDIGSILNFTESDIFSFSEWLRMFRLVWTNAMQYNPPANDIHLIAKRFSYVFESKVIRAQQNPDSLDPCRMTHVFQLLVTAISEEFCASDFVSPVDHLTFSDYPSIIAKPLCFTQIINDLEAHHYCNMYDLQDDALLIFKNAIDFNGSTSSFGIAANFLKEMTLRLFEHRKRDLTNTFLITEEARFSLCEDVSTMSNEDRLDIVKKIKSVCSDAIRSVNSKESIIILDMLNVAQFSVIQSIVRTMKLKKTMYD
tara:strand:- start:375 stop:1400 length:1026 start_codon:yes stop_codon:yes gene_type:complete